MAEISASKYVVTAATSPDRDAWWWHLPTRIKVCSHCGEGKPLSEFYAYGYKTTQGKPRTRYESRCKPCARDRRKEQYHSDVEGEAVRAAVRRARNLEKAKIYRREQQKLPAVKALKAFHQRLRKARMRAKSGDGPAIRAIYAEAMAVEKIVACCPVFDIPELGKKMHVDHIEPLARGGKHEAGNLQILPIGMNMRKGTKCPR